MTYEHMEVTLMQVSAKLRELETRFGKIEGQVLSNSDKLNGLQKNVDTLKEILRG